MNGEAALLVASALLALTTSVMAEPSDARIRDLLYDPKAVVTLPVRRGIVTLLVLDHDEVITDVAAGLGSDCGKVEATWCIAAQAGGRDIFVKPKSNASATNNLAVVTDKRRHTFRFVVLGDADTDEPVYRLTVRAPVPRMQAASSQGAQYPLLAVPSIPEPDPRNLVAERLGSLPTVVNADYSLAEGKAAADIVPTLVFDDGRFTYFRFPGNREVPAAFHVLPDGSETLLNARMEGDLLVVDRVSRRLVLRAGSAVVGVWNEAFDVDGQPPSNGTTVPGVHRTVKGGETP